MSWGIDDDFDTPVGTGIDEGRFSGTGVRMGIDIDDDIGIDEDIGIGDMPARIGNGAVAGHSSSKNGAPAAGMKPTGT